MAHHFISYSNADAADFALTLHNALEAGPPPIPCWLDKNKLQPALDWDLQIRDAIRDCETVLFLMSADSVTDLCVCREEWTLAFKYKKPVIPLLITPLHTPGMEIPFRLQNRQHIDFSGSFDTALAQLRQHLGWRKSPAGELYTLEERLKDAERDLRRAREDSDRARITKEIAELKEDIARQKKIVDDPAGAAQAAERSIETRLELERQPERAPQTRTKFINPPPATAPDYFQDRHVETQQIGDFLKNETLRLLTVVGRAGNGKTALACRLLKALESGHLPDDLGPLPVEGIVYLSATGSRRVTVPHLYADLCKLLPDAIAQELDGLYRNPQASTEDKLRVLLDNFPSGRVVLLLDNFEDVVDPETFKITDAELDEALRALLKLPQHAVKVIITTRVLPRDLRLFQPARQHEIHLDEGLGSPYAEKILSAMDRDGSLGLRDLPEDDPRLREARERTCGYPRALESLYAILSADRSTTLAEMLADIRQREEKEGAARLLPENVVEVMVGEAFNRLDPTARLVMQALAVYGRPVPPVAVDYLLQPHRPGLDSAGVLARLVNMHFARKDGGAYKLHPVDRAYALGLIPRGEKPFQPHPQSLPASGERLASLLPPAGEGPGLGVHREGPGMGGEAFTQIALSTRGADYFKSARKPRSEWKRVQDLEAQLAEIDLRCAAEDYDTAARVLTEIDGDYLFLWGHYRLMAQLHERLQGKIDDLFLKANSLNNLALVYNALGRVRDAITCYEAALPAAQELKNRQAEGAILGNLGTAYSNLGQVTRAIDYYEQALAIAREIGDRRGEGNRLGNLGLAYSDLGQVTRAIDYYEQALAIAREIGDRRGEGADLGNLGNAYSDLGQVARAIDYYEQTLAISREIGERLGESHNLVRLGLIWADKGQTSRAIDYYEQALVIYREIGSKYGESIALGNLGSTYNSLGQYRRAQEFYEQTLAIKREIGERVGESIWITSTADIYINQGEWLAAITACREAIQIADEIGLVQIQSHGRSALAEAHLYSGDLPAARTVIEAARQYDYPTNNHSVLALLGVIALRQGDQAAAGEAFAAAVVASDALLVHSDQNYGALDVKGLALCGLALIPRPLLPQGEGELASPPNPLSQKAGEGEQSGAPVVLLPEGEGYRVRAEAAFRAARAITSAPGIVAGVLRQFDALAVADTAGVLAGVRAVIVG